MGKLTDSAVWQRQFLRSYGFKDYSPTPMIIFIVNKSRDHSPEGFFNTDNCQNYWQNLLLFWRVRDGEWDYNVINVWICDDKYPDDELGQLAMVILTISGKLQVLDLGQLAIIILALSIYMRQFLFLSGSRDVHTCSMIILSQKSKSSFHPRSVEKL